MTDVQISFLSLVDKAANKREFLVKKNALGKPEVKFSASILKADTSTHEITGVVYEPLVEDAHGNFMTAEEIKKAADWFNEHGLGVDIQHAGTVVDGVTIVKSWVVEENTEINGQIVKAGTWLATAKIDNDEVWQKVEKGEITGWSMGGVGNYSTTDVDLAEVEKSLGSKILSGIAKAFGFTWDGTAISDTSFNEKYEEKNKNSKFWNAWNTLEDFLLPFKNESTWETYFQDNQQVIIDSLNAFSEAIKEVLGANNVWKALEPPKEILEKVSSKGDEGMNAEEIKKAVSEAVVVALEPIQKELNALKASKEVAKEEPKGEVSKSEEVENVGEVVKAAISEALAPICKDIETLKVAKGISKQLENEESEVENPSEPVNKSVFAGMFNLKGGCK